MSLDMEPIIKINTICKQPLIYGETVHMINDMLYLWHGALISRYGNQSSHWFYGNEVGYYYVNNQQRIHKLNSEIFGEVLNLNPRGNKS